MAPSDRLGRISRRATVPVEQDQSVLGDRRPGKVAAEVLEAIVLVVSDRDGGVQTVAVRLGAQPGAAAGLRERTGGGGRGWFDAQGGRAQNRVPAERKVALGRGGGQMTEP